MIVFLAIAFVVSTDFFASMISALGEMPSFSVLAAPASRKVQSILENRAFRREACVDTECLCRIEIDRNRLQLV